MKKWFESRKLWAFIVVALIIVLNITLSLGMPPADLLYLVVLTASYILGQGYVDAKQQPVKDLPVADITNSLGNIIQTELAKIPSMKSLPIDEIMTTFKGILASEMSKINNLTIVSAPVAPSAVVPVGDSTITQDTVNP